LSLPICWVAGSSDSPWNKSWMLNMWNGWEGMGWWRRERRENW
jgi:hypothetical protein